MIAMKASEIASVIQGTLHGEDVTVTEAAVINSAEAIGWFTFLGNQRRESRWPRLCS